MRFLIRFLNWFLAAPKRRFRELPELSITHEDFMQHRDAFYASMRASRPTPRRRYKPYGQRKGALFTKVVIPDEYWDKLSEDGRP